MNKKNKIVFMIIIGIALIVVLLIGGSYAWLSFRTNDISVAGNTKCFDINYWAGGNISGNVGAIDERLFITNDTITIDNTMALSSVGIEIDANCNQNGLGTIELNVSSLASSFTASGNNAYALKYVIADYNPSVDGEATMNNLNGKTFNMIKRGSIASTGKIDIFSDYLASGEEHNYLIILYINNELAPSSIVGNVINATVTARVEEFIPTPLSDFEYYTGTYTTPSGSDATIPNGKVLLVKYNGTDTTVNIPSKYNINGTDYDTAIYSYQDSDFNKNKSVFFNNKTITHVNFADNILAVSTNIVDTTIKYDRLFFTFYGCSSLVSVTNLPEAQYLYFTFQDCTSLESISNIPNNLINMYHSFYNCSSLRDAPVIPDGVTSMNSTFTECTSLLSAPVIPSLVTNIEFIFYNCSSLGGTILINSPNIASLTSSAFNTSTSKIILIDVPAGSQTLESINNTGISTFPEINITVH